MDADTKIGDTLTRCEINGRGSPIQSTLKNGYLVSRMGLVKDGSSTQIARIAPRIALESGNTGTIMIKNGIRFAPPKIAAQFSMENENHLFGLDVISVFGFHGKHFRDYFLKKYILRSSIGEW